MTFLDLLLLLVVAGLAGSLGQAVAGYSHGGCIVSVVLGLIGAGIGTWIARVLMLPDIFTLSIGGQRFPLVWAVVGAALFVALINLITHRERR